MILWEGTIAVSATESVWIKDITLIVKIVLMCKIEKICRW